MPFEAQAIDEEKDESVIKHIYKEKESPLWQFIKTLIFNSPIGFIRICFGGSD
jgi:hypothetical protein